MRPTTRRRVPVVPRMDCLEGRALLSTGGAPAEILVRFAEGTSAAHQGAVLRALGGHVVASYAQGPSVVALDGRKGAGAALATLRNDPMVVYAEPDATLHAAAVAPDPLLGLQWGLENANDVDVNATTGWALAAGLPPTTVAMIDSGIDLTSPEFAGRIWVNPGEVPNNGLDDDLDGLPDDVFGWNFVNNTANVQDDNGHGTHVAAILTAAANNGVAGAGVDPFARLMVLKTIGRDGSGTVDAAVAAIYYAANHGARVINASWDGAAYSQAMADAVAYANLKGVVFVSAAGNESANNDIVRTYPSSLRLPNTITVAAATPVGSLAGFSNYGPNTVDLAAPGVNVTSIYPGGGAVTLSGTSMATPFVSGVAALVAAQHPEFTAAQVVGRLLSTVKPLPGLAGLTVTGGLVDATRALLDIENPKPAPPPPATITPAATVPLPRRRGRPRHLPPRLIHRQVPPVLHAPLRRAGSRLA